MPTKLKSKIGLGITTQHAFCFLLDCIFNGFFFNFFSYLHTLLLNPDSKDDSDDENDPSKLSLAERVKLFNQAMTSERVPVMGSPDQHQSNRRRAPNSRFKTQPVTIEEVSTAQNIIKQPLPELIGGHDWSL